MKVPCAAKWLSKCKVLWSQLRDLMIFHVSPCGRKPPNKRKPQNIRSEKKTIKMRQKEHVKWRMNGDGLRTDKRAACWSWDTECWVKSASTIIIWRSSTAVPLKAVQARCDKPLNRFTYALCNVAGVFFLLCSTPFHVNTHCSCSGYIQHRRRDAQKSFCKKKSTFHRNANFSKI